MRYLIVSIFLLLSVWLSAQSQHRCGADAWRANYPEYRPDPNEEWIQTTSDPVQTREVIVIPVVVHVVYRTSSQNISDEQIHLPDRGTQ